MSKSSKGNSKGTNRLNYRSKYSVIDEVEMARVFNGVQQEGNEVFYNIQFNDYTARDVYIHDESTLEYMRADSSIKSVGDTREVTYQNIDEIVKQL